MCDFDDGDRASVWSVQRIGAARKKHRCDACGSAIAVGESYVRVFMVVDGDPSEDVACLACWTIAEAFGSEHHFTPSPAYLLECLDGCASADELDQWGRAANEIRARGRNKCPAESVVRA